jgi:hypothetical protein
VGVPRLTISDAAAATPVRRPDAIAQGTAAAFTAASALAALAVVLLLSTVARRRPAGTA